MVQKKVGHDMDQFHKWSNEGPVLECAAVILRGKKSKLGEVLCQVQMVECLAYNEGAEDLCAQD
jgi:hypothetical protein